LGALQQRVLGIVLAGGATVLVLLLTCYLLLASDLQPLTPEALTTAERLWQAAAVESYDIDIEISGRQPGRVHLECRHSEVTAMTRDGRAPSQRRTWDAWTVDHQLATIRDELNKVADPARGFGAPPESRVVQLVRFDPQYGFPLEYRRAILGTELDVAWRTVRFTPINSTTDAR
jgi:hypothetical protein